MTEVPHLREAGADIVIVLAHTGIGPAASAPDSADPALEHAALALATVPGIDALLTGHSHQVFPETTAPGPSAPGVDHHAGTLAGVPAVMAGFRGSHLGVLDLCLAQDAATAAWSVQDFHCRAQPVAPADGTAPAAADPDLSAVTRPAHLATLQVTSQTVGHTAHPIHSYFARVRPCNALHPVLDAKTAALSAALGDTEDTDLPVLAATPCYKSGGHGGPGDFIDIPAGPLTLGHMAELYPFPNTLIGLRLTGAQIADWLERAASCFHQILPGHGTTPQPLWNPAFASHAFDTISGLSYRIDLSQPPRYDPQGQLIDSDARRIRDLSRNGTPLSHDALFCVATNNFHAHGGAPIHVPQPRPWCIKVHAPSVTTSPRSCATPAPTAPCPSPAAGISTAREMRPFCWKPARRAQSPRRPRDPGRARSWCGRDRLPAPRHSPCQTGRPCESPRKLRYPVERLARAGALANPVRSGRKQP